MAITARQRESLVPVKAMIGILGKALGIDLAVDRASRRLDWRILLSVASARVSALLLLGLLLSYLFAALRYPYYLPLDLVEEWAYGYTTSSNFLTYGFLQSGFLADCSNSPFPGDHPYTYTHMPPGPDILIALILKATGNSYFALRIVLGFAFFSGIWFYYRFAQSILEKTGLPAAGFALILVGPAVWAQMLDRSVYVLYPLLAFSPYVALAAYYRTNGTIYLVTAVLVAFISSLYIEYSLLAAMVVCWLLLHATRLLRIDRKHLYCVIGAIGAGVLLHLVQNILFLGSDVFFKDLLYTIGNRTVGIPSREAVRDFYDSVFLVHHGSGTLEIVNIIAQVPQNLSVPSAALFLLTALFGLALLSKVRLFASGRLLVTFDAKVLETVKRLLSMAGWIALTIVIPIVLFPAYSQEVTLAWSGANKFYLAIGQTALLGIALTAVLAPPNLSFLGKGTVLSIRLWRKSDRPQLLTALEGAARFALWIVLVLLVAVLTLRLTHQLASEYGRVLKANFSSNDHVLLEDLKRFGGDLYLTNVNTPIVGFFTRSPGLGVCEQDVISSDGKIDSGKCPVARMRHTASYRQEAPKYFFFFGQDKFVPGFATKAMLQGSGRIVLKSRLDAHFHRIHENAIFSVYDLHEKPRP